MTAAQAGEWRAISAWAASGRRTPASPQTIAHAPIGVSIQMVFCGMRRPHGQAFVRVDGAQRPLAKPSARPSPQAIEKNPHEPVPPWSGSITKSADPAVRCRARACRRVTTHHHRLSGARGAHRALRRGCADALKASRALVTGSPAEHDRLQTLRLAKRAPGLGNRRSSAYETVEPGEPAGGARPRLRCDRMAGTPTPLIRSSRLSGRCREIIFKRGGGFTTNGPRVQQQLGVTAGLLTP